MEIKITGIGDKGDLNNERIGFIVLKECDLQHYLVLKAGFSKTNFYNISEGAYWFLPQKVKVGDKIILYSKNGTSSIEENNDGTKSYFFYWGLKEPVYKKTEGIVLVEAKNWSLSKDF